jgi:hypothetical protein
VDRACECRFLGKTALTPVDSLYTYRKTALVPGGRKAYSMMLLASSYLKSFVKSCAYSGFFLEEL